MPRAWCQVSKGRATAPPASGCIIGVSTSRKPRSAKKRRTKSTTRVRVRKVSRVSSFMMRST